VTPILKELSGEYAGRIKFGKVNVDEQPALADRYQIRSIPCLILFRDGQALDALIGARSASEYRDWLNRFLEPGPA
jgi:thioredoxin 1